VGKQVRFSVEARSAASSAAIYALLGDGATWPDWTPFTAFELEREGEAGGESQGAIRVLTSGRIRNREELTELTQDRMFSYRSLSGMPIRNHRASVNLAPAAGGTLITWHEQFEPTWPGSAWYLTRTLRKFVQACADGLATHAAEASNPPAAPPG
jgi:Polyketide cyclase / dehydrase and lipid transport